MKKINLALLIGCFAWIFSMDDALAEETLPLDDPVFMLIEENVLNPFFAALKAGDVTTLKAMIDGEMYNNNKILIEQNKQYPDFLRNHYGGAVFRVIKAAHINGNVMVEVKIEYASGDQGVYRWWLLKVSGKSEGSDSQINQWKVVNSERK
jgi:hypothetical protein